MTSRERSWMPRWWALALALAAACGGRVGPALPSTRDADLPKVSRVSTTPILRPKYGAGALPLSHEHAYLRGAASTDYWTLAPYYVGQRDDVSCSLASLTMLVNAARRGLPKRAEDALVDQAALFERVNSPVWRRGLAPGGEGVTLEELAVLAERSLAVYGLTPRRVEMTQVRAATPDALARLREVLSASEANPNDWLIFNFLTEVYVGTGDYGHISPVGAYDAGARRVLILDPDRGWYEPYWVTDETALAGMATIDEESGEPRGYLRVTSCPATGC